MPHALAEPEIPLRIAILGWLGSRERHLRPLGSFYEGLGADVHLFVADGRRALLHHDGYAREARGRFRAMAETLGRMRSVLRDKHALFIWGDADELVPHAFVETFAAACEAEGVLVERKFFPGSTHVRHFVTHRAAYLEATSRFVASI